MADVASNQNAYLEDDYHDLFADNADLEDAEDEADFDGAEFDGGDNDGVDLDRGDLDSTERDSVNFIILMLMFLKAVTLGEV